MGLFNLFKKEPNPEEVDYLAIGADMESKGDYASAIGEYEKAILILFSKKEPRFYRHITKKIIDCYVKIGDYEKVMDMWPQRYDESEYGAKEMYELIKILEAGQRIDLVMKVYDNSGNKLTANRIEFLIKQKKIPEANALLTQLLSGVTESHPSAITLWLTKSKLCLSLRKWEEANKYLNKILEKNPHHEEARKLKEFCFKQLRSS